MAGKPVTIVVRVSAEMAQAIDQVRGSLSRARWADAVIEAQLRKEASLMPGEEVVPASKVKAAAGGCPHPRARVIKGFCYRCGSLVLPK